MYVGGGLALVGIFWMISQNQSQAAAATAALPAAAPAPGTSVGSQAIAVGSAYAQCIANGGTALSCLGLSQS
jgi:hypothetical protein